MLDLRLHVVPLSNAEKDNTGHYVKAYNVTPQQFAALVDRVNVTYVPTNIRFVFDPEFDRAPMADTELNTDGPNMRTRGNQIAAAFPGKIVCLLRWVMAPARPGMGMPTPRREQDPSPQTSMMSCRIISRCPTKSPTDRTAT